MNPMKHTEAAALAPPYPLDPRVASIKNEVFTRTQPASDLHVCRKEERASTYISPTYVHCYWIKELLNRFLHVHNLYTVENVSCV